MAGLFPAHPAKGEAVQSPALGERSPMREAQSAPPEGMRRQVFMGENLVRQSLLIYFLVQR